MHRSRCGEGCGNVEAAFETIEIGVCRQLADRRVCEQRGKRVLAITVGAKP